MRKQVSGMDVAAELSDCKPVEQFMFMLLERVATLEESLQRIEQNLNDPLHGLHATNEFVAVKKSVSQARGNGFHKCGLRSKPAVAAIMQRVWEVLVDSKLTYQSCLQACLKHNKTPWRNCLSLQSTLVL